MGHVGWVIQGFKFEKYESSQVTLQLLSGLGGGGGVGGGGTQQCSIRGDSVPRSKPLPFYIPFLIEKVPL